MRDIAAHGATELLGTFVAGHNPSPADSAAARRSLTEFRRCVVVGSTTSAAGLLREIAHDATGGVNIPAMDAWLSAGTAIASGMDDTVEYGSAGAPVWSALEALPLELDDAEQAAAGATGLRLALAVYRAGKYQESARGFSGTGVFGILAATAACANALGLAAEKASSALAIAASQAHGLAVDAGWTTGGLHAAGAARDAVASVLLAADGLAGAPDIFEARQGFGEAYFGLAESRLDDLGDRLEHGPGLEEDLRFKVVPGHADHQRPVRALQALRSRYGSATGVILEGVPPTSGGNRFSAPTTAAQALHSVRHALARVLQHGSVSLADIEEPVTAVLEPVEVRSSSRWDPRLLEPGFAGWELSLIDANGERSRIDPQSMPASADPSESQDAWRVLAARLDDVGARALEQLEEGA